MPSLTAFEPAAFGAPAPKRRLFWVGLLAVAALQLLALSYLCKDQVSRAAVREAELKAALAKCLESTPKANFTLCTTR